MKAIQAIDVLHPEKIEDVPWHRVVRFFVEPPVMDLPGSSKQIRLDDSEGVIDVKIEEKGITIRGRHSIVIEPVAANTVRIYLEGA